MGMDLTNKVVAITGGARGIGLETAKALKLQGAKICIGDIDIQLAEQVANNLGVIAAKVDVRSQNSFDQFIASVNTSLGPVDILINNAGIMPKGLFDTEKPAISDTQIDINFRGVIHGVRSVLGDMRTRKQGHIINIASMAGRFAIPGSAVYVGTKFAVIGLTESLAAENRNSGVKFSVVMPAKVNTDLSAGTDEASKGLMPTVQPEDVAAKIVAVIQRPRLFAAVPEYLRLVHALNELVPAGIRNWMMQKLGDERIYKKLDVEAHAFYADRIEALTEKK